MSSFICYPSTRRLARFPSRAERGSDISAARHARMRGLPRVLARYLCAERAWRAALFQTPRVLPWLPPSVAYAPLNTALPNTPFSHGVTCATHGISQRRSLLSPCLPCRISFAPGLLHTLRPHTRVSVNFAAYCALRDTFLLRMGSYGQFSGQRALELSCATTPPHAGTHLPYLQPYRNAFHAIAPLHGTLSLSLSAV